jgi:DNA-binding beta-propeller fold protein YncE
MRRLAALLCLLAGPAWAAEDPAALYARHCAACHGEGRLGGTGPALLPENLGRLKPAEAEKVIAQGRFATQMPGFAESLGSENVKALTAWVFTPLPEVPQWGLAEIAASRVTLADEAALPARPPFESDPMNLFTVVETGDHHVTILDGDRMAPLTRVPTRFALHGGAKYSPDGRFVYLMSRDGWVSKTDMWTGKVLAEVRAGINARNIAVSHDGRTVMVGNVLPHSVVLLDARDLAPLKMIPAPSRVSAVYAAPPRNSFLVALKDVKEMWEISYAEDPPAVFNGLVHNYEAGMVEGMAEKGRFPVRRIVLEDYLDDFFCDPKYQNVIGASRDGKSGRVINLFVGRQIATLALSGMPHLGSGITFNWQGRPVMATPNLAEAVVSVIDMTDWKEIKRIPTCGPGFFLRGHENSPYAWVDCSLSGAKDQMQVIDTRTLEVAKTLRPAPGRLTRHVEFDRKGAHVLVSVSEADGAILVLDAESFDETTRLPAKNPIGKYNVWNKVTYSAGTSH